MIGGLWLIYSFIKAFIAFHLKANSKWDPTAVSLKTPHDITAFITHKCGNSVDGFGGCKVCFLFELQYL